MRRFKLQSILLVGLAVGLLMAASAVKANIVLDVTEVQITSTAAFEITPALGDDGSSAIVVYTSLPTIFDPGTIYYQRFDDTGLLGDPVKISFDGTDNQLADVSGDYIVYTAYVDSDSRLGYINLHEISTGATTTISSLARIEEARIDGLNVAWVEGAVDYTKIMYFNLENLGKDVRPTMIAGVIPPASNVEIDGTFIVWQALVDGQWDVAAYDLRNGTSAYVAADPQVDEYNPTTSGSWVAWQVNDADSGTRIEAKNLDTNETRVVADNGADNSLPSMRGDVIAWDGNLAGNYDIYLYRISVGDTFQATSHSANQLLNNVFGNQVAYVDNRDSISDVFVSTFSFLPNDPPVADAGPDQPFTVTGTAIELDGTASWDPDVDPITYLWTIETQPGGSSVSLDDPESATPSFVPDVWGTYVFKLVVTDQWDQESDPDYVTVSFENLAPVADAGLNQYVEVGDTVTLDGTGSYDPNENPITYSWTFDSKPEGSSAAIDPPGSATASFVPDVDGTYVVILVVSDGSLDSDPGMVTITATVTQAQVEQKLGDCIGAINGLSAGSFKNKNMQNALTNKIIAALELIDQGFYQEALDKLMQDILAKTNGCNDSGEPDKNDWIEDCDSQDKVYSQVMEAVSLLQGMI